MFWYGGDTAAPGATTGGRKCTTRTASRCGTAAASASGARSTIRRTRHHLQLLGRQPARLRPAAARPQLRALPGRRELRARAPASGSSRSATGATGAVQLVEIPTDDEIHDNIVAFWVPREPAVAGAAYAFNYRLHWMADEPYPAEGRGDRGDPDRSRRPARPAATAGRAQVHRRVRRRGARRDWRPDRDVPERHGLARRDLLPVRRAGPEYQALARPVRPDGVGAPSRSSCGLFCRWAASP